MHVPLAPGFAVIKQEGQSYMDDLVYSVPVTSNLRRSALTEIIKRFEQEKLHFGLVPTGTDKGTKVYQLWRAPQRGEKLMRNPPVANGIIVKKPPPITRFTDQWVYGVHVCNRQTHKASEEWLESQEDGE